MNSVAMPPAEMPDGSDPVALLDAYLQAEDWANGATTTKQMNAWQKRAEALRALVLERMK